MGRTGRVKWGLKRVREEEGGEQRPPRGWKEKRKRKRRRRRRRRSEWCLHKNKVHATDVSTIY